MIIQNIEGKFIKKPKNNRIYGKIANQLKNKKPVMFRTTNDLKDLVKTNKVLKPAVYIDGKFIGASCVILDFDDVDYKKVKRISKKYNFEPTLAHKTLSQRQGAIKRFRFIYMFDETVTDEHEYKNINFVINKLYNGYVDKHCGTIKKWYLTGRKNTQEILIDSGKSYDLKYLRIKFSYLLQDVYKSNRTITKRSNVKKNFSSYNVEQVFSVTEGTIKNNCELYNDFTNNDIHHDLKFLLLSSLINIEHGDLWFRKHLTKNHNKWEKSIEFSKKNGYNPMRCENMCPYYNKCKKQSLYENIKEQYQYSTYKKDNNGIHPDYIYQQFIDSMKESMKDDNEIIIYKIPTGVGKTTAILRHFSDKSVMAFPNHALKDEKINEFIEIKGKYPFSTKNLKDYVDEDVYKKASRLYNTGRSFDAKKLIGETKKGKEYLKLIGLPLVNNTFTTHDKIFHSNFNNVNTIIFDEDPIDTIFKVNTYNSFEKDIDRLKNILTKKEIKNIRKMKKDIDKFEYPKKYGKKFDDNKIVSKIIDSDVVVSKMFFGWISANIYFKNSFASTKQFPKNKKIIIVSATPDVEFYETNYNNVKFYNFSNVKMKGKIFFHSMNTSKNSFLNGTTKHMINNINDHTETNKTITFKKYKEMFEKDEENIPYGGNIMGYNSLSGENITIAYTYNKPSLYYAFKTVQHGGKIDKNFNKMSYRKITFNGEKMSMMVYSNKFMRQIQLNTINNEMLQAIGRARLVRNDANVNICSRFRPAI